MKTQRSTNGGTFLASMIATLATMLALAAGAVAAPAYEGFEMARFKVEVEGTSNTIWHSALEAETECEISDHSFGRERYTFATKKPFVITATYSKGDLNPRIFSGRSAVGVPVVARINRSFTPSITLPAGSCEANGGGAEPVQPDCGPRTVPWHVEIEFSDKKRNGLQLHGDSGAKRQYEHCPTAPYTFPTLLDERNPRTDQPLFADLSPDDLFDPHLQKWITIGDGSYGEGDDSFRSTTKVHWTVSFTRLKGK